MIELIRRAKEMGASDLHLTVGAPPFARIHGEIAILPDLPLTQEAIREIALPLCTEHQIAGLEKDRELCFSLQMPDIGYCRLNYYFSERCLEVSIRIGTERIRSFEELGLPPIIETISRHPAGLFLITGATGQGKTTTFNTVMDFINRDRRCKIITIEDPIEYLHKNIRSVVVQQEIGSDVTAFHLGLRSILRQDPDVIGIGEMRDLETISAAVTAAETGHFVLATLHTMDCSQTISRIIDVFPPHQQEQIRVQLSMILVAIVNQRLLPRVDGAGRVLATEVLIANEAIRNIIRENKLQQIPSLMSLGRSYGMQMMDDQLKGLYHKGVITYDIALTHMSGKTDFRRKT